MKPKYTPGPWNVGSFGSLIFTEKGICIGEAFDRGYETKSSRANSILMSKAPEMHELLNAIYESGSYDPIFHDKIEKILEPIK